ncbi:MAG: hypothetical protein IT178_03070, partial [Acidobacteria bacterium]|nr:hypothetical protein [Acidobacteriota bacterium]
MSLMFDLVFRVSLLLSIGLVLTLLLRRPSAAVRHSVLAATVVAALMLPLASLVAPEWQGHWPWPTSTWRADVAAPDSPSNASGNVTPSTSTVEEFTIAAGSPAAVASRLSPS